MKKRSTLSCLFFLMFLLNPLSAEEILPPPLPPENGLPTAEESQNIDLDSLEPALPADADDEQTLSEPDTINTPEQASPLDAFAPLQGSSFDGRTPENAIYNASYDQHYYIEAVALFKQKQYDEAVELFSKIGPSSSYYVSAMTFKGLIASRLGDYGLAYATYQRALKINPLNDDLLHRVERMHKLLEQSDLFQARGPVKKITRWIRKTKKGKRIKQSVSIFSKGGYKTKETRYKHKKPYEISTYAYYQDGTLKKEMVANKKGILKHSTTWSRDPLDAAGHAQGASWIAVDKDKKNKITQTRIWTEFDSRDRAQKMFVLDADGSELRREEYAYDGPKVLIEIYEGGSLSQRQEETRDQFNNPVKAMRQFKETEFLLKYDEFGNWIRQETHPPSKGHAVIERDFVFFGR